MARNTNQSNEVVLPIEGEMTIFFAQELREAIMPMIAGNDDIDINLSRVTEVDAAGMQLMISAKLEAVLHGKMLRYSQHSQAVLDMIDLCNLGSFFGDQLVIPSEATLP